MARSSCICLKEIWKRSALIIGSYSERCLYPLLLPDEVQDRLSGSKVFSKLDLHSGYWQLSVKKEEGCIMTAFCPAPGMGLYEFYRMPFGVTGGPSSFQRQGVTWTTICNQLY